MLLSSVADQFEVALQLEQDQARRDEVAAQQAALAAGQQRQQAARAVIQPILKELFIDDPPPNLFQPPPVARSNPPVLLVEKPLLLHQEQQVPKETARKSSMGKSHAPKSSRKDSVGPSNCKRSKRDEEEDDVLKGDEDNCSEVIRLKHQLNILYQKNKEERIAVEKAKMNLAKSGIQPRFIGECCVKLCQVSGNENTRLTLYLISKNFIISFFRCVDQGDYSIS